jgi:hypothetical protein
MLKLKFMNLINIMSRTYFNNGFVDSYVSNIGLSELLQTKQKLIECDK